MHLAAGICWGGQQFTLAAELMQQQRGAAGAQIGNNPGREVAKTVARNRTRQRSHAAPTEMANGDGAREGHSAPRGSVAGQVM